MKNIFKIISLTISTILLISCEKEVDFNGKISEPLVVVNSYITSDSIISANISESKFFLYDKNRIEGISNAKVSVYINGIMKEEMKHVNLGNYKGTYQPKPGEFVKLIVNVPKRTEVSCQEKVLEKINFVLDTASVIGKIQYNTTENASGKIDTISKYFENKNLYKVKIKDNPLEKNYYRLIFIKKEKFGLDNRIYKIYLNENVDPSSYTSDPLSSSSESNEYNIFSDDIFNGKEVTIKCNFNETVYMENYAYNNQSNSTIEYIVTLQHISKDYYMYLKTRSASKNDDFLSEPVQVHNNIIGGIGVLGSYASTTKYITIK